MCGWFILFCRWQFSIFCLWMGFSMWIDKRIYCASSILWTKTIKQSHSCHPWMLLFIHDSIFYQFNHQLTMILNSTENLLSLHHSNFVMKAFNAICELWHHMVWQLAFDLCILIRLNCFYLLKRGKVGAQLWSLFDTVKRFFEKYHAWKNWFQYSI